jgi:hypothetical protein
MDYKILIFGIVIGLLFGVLIGYLSFSSPKLRVCPDSWTIDAMPPTVREYLTIKGARVEKSSFDIDWVKKNCDIEPGVVQ